jgi:hypothetical protein
LPDPPWSEDLLRTVFNDFHTLAEHKYNKYEMYQPGRLFFEHLYLFLAKLKEDEDKTVALNFVHNSLIFISRDEFQQLAHILYYDRIRQRQLDFVSDLLQVDRYRLHKLTESHEFRNMKRASLFVALSDGARIDYFRRQNLDINNEQVLASYSVGPEKTEDISRSLSDALQTPDAKFDCLFLLDDFCGSGRTLLREVAVAELTSPIASFKMPAEFRGRLKYDEPKLQLEWAYSGPITNGDLQRLRSISAAPDFLGAVDLLRSRCEGGQTKIKGSLVRIAEQQEHLLGLLSDRARIYLSPLLATEYAISRLEPLIARLPARLSKLQITPAAVIPNSARIDKDTEPIAIGCAKPITRPMIWRMTTLPM